MEEEKKPSGGAGSGDSQKKVMYAVIAVAVVILAVVLVAKFGFGTDLLNPEGGQMSLVQNRSMMVTTPLVQRVITPIPKLCPAGTTGCSGTCVDLNVDAGNCGSCGNACASGGFCNKANCYYPGTGPTCQGVICDPTTACCAGRCVRKTDFPTGYNCNT
jgi:hypothetical protein